MKTISVSVDDETHRLARIRAAHTGTTMSAARPTDGAAATSGGTGAG